MKRSRGYYKKKGKGHLPHGKKVLRKEKGHLSEVKEGTYGVLEKVKGSAASARYIKK